MTGSLNADEWRHLCKGLTDAERDELLRRLLAAAPQGGEALMEVLEETLLHRKAGDPHGADAAPRDGTGLHDPREGDAGDDPGRDPDCDFCTMPAARIIAENGLAYAVRDAYPVSPLHTLVIPKRHVASYFSLYLPERRAVERLIDLIHGDILERDDAVMGFNVGINQGEVAGQSIFHCHVHVIPRRWGDDPKPRGGVRKAVRGEGDYPCRPA